MLMCSGVTLPYSKGKGHSIACYEGKEAASWVWVINAISWLLYSQKRGPVPIVQEAW
jgi:hypothetical protein